MDVTVTLLDVNDNAPEFLVTEEDIALETAATFDLVRIIWFLPFPITPKKENAQANHPSEIRTHTHCSSRKYFCLAEINRIPVTNCTCDIVFWLVTLF